MREMKDSGVEWIGEIPRDWEVLKLRRIGDFTASGIDKLIVPEQPLVKIINYTDVYRNKEKKLRRKEYMTVSAPQEKIINNLVAEGDLIFTPSSETIEEIGESALVDDILENTAYSYHVLRFRFNVVVSKQFKKYLCNNHYVQNVFSSKATGSIRKTLSREDFKEQKVIIPPLETQHRIADYLDRKCSKIDEIIEKESLVIEKLKAYKLSVITEAVTKGLNPDVPMKDSGIEWIGEVPVHWECTLLSALFKQRKNKNKGMMENNLLSLSYGRIIKKNINSNEGLLPESFENYNIIEVGDIVFRLTDLQNDKRSLRTGLCKEKGIITSAYVTLAQQEQQNASYMHYLFHSYDICKVFYGMGDGVRQGMGYDDLKKLRVLLPSMFEQQQIADYLDQKCTQIDETITKKQATIEKLTAYKKSLIYEVVTGKKEV